MPISVEKKRSRAYGSLQCQITLSTLLTIYERISEFKILGPDDSRDRRRRCCQWRWQRHPRDPWIHHRHSPNRRRISGKHLRDWRSVFDYYRNRRQRCSPDHRQQHPSGTWIGPLPSPPNQKRSALGRLRRISVCDDCYRRWRSLGWCCSLQYNVDVLIGHVRYRRSQIYPRTCHPIEIPAKRYFGQSVIIVIV